MTRAINDTCSVKCFAKGHRRHRRKCRQLEPDQRVRHNRSLAAHRRAASMACSPASTCLTRDLPGSKLPNKSAMCRHATTNSARISIEFDSSRFFGPLPQFVSGMKYVLVFLDVFTKYIKLFVLVHATAKAALGKCKIFVQELGKPTTVLAYNGTQFTSEVWSTGLTNMGIKTTSISVRHPQSNPSERLMRELARMLRILCHSKQQNRKRHYKLVREHGLRPGHLVLVRVHDVRNQTEFVTKKFLQVFSGPYRISKVIQDNCMELVGEDNEQVVGRFNRICLFSHLNPRTLAQKSLSVCLPFFLGIIYGIGGRARRESAWSKHPTKANRVQSLAGSPDFRKCESCRTMPLVGGSSRGSPASPTPSFRRRSIFISITLIGSQDLAVKSRPNLFPPFLPYCTRIVLLSSICFHKWERLAMNRTRKRVTLPRSFGRVSSRYVCVLQYSFPWKVDEIIVNAVLYDRLDFLLHLTSQDTSPAAAPPQQFAPMADSNFSKFKQKPQRSSAPFQRTSTLLSFAAADSRNPEPDLMNAFTSALQQLQPFIAILQPIIPLIEHNEVDDAFMSTLVCSDGVTFHTNGKVNRHKVRIWGQEHPHETT
ncbi:hypothetical protein PR048_003328 [Dryococelus australis]|uniref:Integrase catalytic domain-containing protein n=1 Tax=Dryococelus australis TaxID=614101 RepID=A0ABQ9IPT7_9NEOP|nr:hypothetical protein PR048_003328 [Dryococelus australis]